MFSLYGIRGPIFQGEMESLGRMPRVARSGPATFARAVGAKEDDKKIHGAFSQAANAYQAMLPENLDRGPLYFAHQIMHPDVITVRDSDKVEQTLQVLVNNQIHQAPVLNTDLHLAGIVSDRDLLKAINSAIKQLDKMLDSRVGDVMTTPVVAAGPMTDIRKIVRAMLEYGVEGVPIVNEKGGLIGFISRTDILSAVVKDPPLKTWR